MDATRFILVKRKTAHLNLGGLSAAGVDSGSKGPSDRPDFKRQRESTQDTAPKKLSVEQQQMPQSEITGEGLREGFGGWGCS